MERTILQFFDRHLKNVIQGSIYTKGVLDRETKTNLTFAAKVVDGRVPERTAYTVVSFPILFHDIVRFVYCFSRLYHSHRYLTIVWTGLQNVDLCLALCRATPAVI